MPGRELRDESAAAVRCPAAPVPANHEMLRLALMDAGRQLRASVDDLEQFPAARDALARFCFGQLLPHLEADESWLLEVRHCAQGRLLADAMRTEARAMTAAVYELAGATGPCEAVSATRVLHALLAAHAHHEQSLVAGGENPVVAVRPSEVQPRLEPQ
jgi:hypothetical protein